MMRTRHTRFGAVLAAMAITACGTGDQFEPTTTLAVTTTTTPTTTTSSAIFSTTTIAGVTTTTEVVTTTTLAGGLPGDPIDFGPAAGDVLAVTGVAHDDVLNLRAAPGADQEIVAGIPPLYPDLVALGRTRELPRSFWIEVEYQGSTGWVNLRYLAYLGAAHDHTASVVDRLGELPAAETMVDLGMIVVRALFSEDPGARIIQSGPAQVGDLGEVIFDALGLGDDSVGGARFHVIAQPEDETFTLKTVEGMPLCSRGVTDDGACI